MVELELTTAGFGGSAGGSSIDPQSSGFEGFGDDGLAKGAGDSKPVARPQSISSGGREVSVVTAAEGSVVGSGAVGLVAEGLDVTGATAGATDSGASKGFEADGDEGGGG